MEKKKDHSDLWETIGKEMSGGKEREMIEVERWIGMLNWSGCEVAGGEREGKKGKGK